MNSQVNRKNNLVEMNEGSAGTCNNSSLALQLSSHLASQEVTLTWQQNSYNYTRRGCIQNLLNPFFNNLPVVG